MGEMGTLDETLSAMLSSDHSYSSSLASVLPSSNAATTEGLSGDFFASQYSSLQSGSLQGSFPGTGITAGGVKPKSSSNFHRAGGFQGNRPSAPSYRNAAEVSQWPFGRDQKFVLDGKNEVLEVTSANNFRPTNLNPPPAGGLQRYHSAPSSFLQSLADFTEDAFSTVAEDSDLLDSFFADNNLAPINERGAQPMDTTGPSVVDAASSTSLKDYEQFLASADFHSPSTHLPNKFSEPQALPGHGGYSTPDALGVRSRPSRINLLRQSSTPADFLAAVQDTLEPDSSSPIFKMPSFLQSPDESNSNMSGITSEAENGKSGNKLQASAEMVTDPPGWLGNSSLRVRVSDPSSPQSKLGLIRHSSLPARSRPFSPTLEVDDLAEFSGTVPCKTRANRGFATHPRSIAERVRRTKISERMKKLQDLVPNMDRQTNTADMLDEAVEYVKHLQTQVQELSNTVVQLKERLGHGN